MTTDNTIPLLLFVVDEGPAAGLGHLRRSRALARELEIQGARCEFMGLDPGDPQTVKKIIRSIRRVRSNAIVVDSYCVSEDDLMMLGAEDRKIIAIDDVGGRRLPVALVLNPGLDAEELQYPGASRVALGHRYTLLRQEFKAEPERRYPETAGRLLITIGGSDPRGLTSRLMRRSAQAFESIHVIVGPYFQGIDEIEAIASAGGHSVSVDPDDVRSLMLGSDLVISGGGQTTLELAATATPAIAIEIAANQRRNLAGLSSRGALLVAGEAASPTIVEDAVAIAESIATNRALREQIGRAGRNLIDGRGAERTSQVILKEIAAAA